MSNRRRAFNIVALALYAVWLAALVGLTLHGRSVALHDLATDKARLDWEDWRAAARKMNDNGPVQRTPPKSPEPPGLILMRDHFGVVMTAAVLFGSVLFAAIVLPLRGVLTSSRTAQPASD